MSKEVASDNRQEKVGFLTFDRDLQECVAPAQLPCGPVMVVQNQALQQLMNKHIQLAHGMTGTQLDRFAGAQPVSLMRRDIPTILQNDYWVAEKTDGHRFLLCFFVLEIVLADKSFRVNGVANDGDNSDSDGGAPKRKRRKKKGESSIEIESSLKKSDTTSLRATYHIICMQDRSRQFYVLNHITAPTYLFPSIQDGELWKTEQGVWELMLFETIQNSKYTISRQFSFENRIKLYTEFTTLLSYPTDQNTLFRVTAKKQHLKRRIRHVVYDIINQQQDPEGAIFTPNDYGVQTGTNDKCFKVKKASKHTFDLKFTSDTTMVVYQRLVEQNDIPIQLRVLGMARVEVDENDQPVKESLIDVKNEYVEKIQGLKETFRNRPIPIDWSNGVFECNWDGQTQSYYVSDKGRREKQHPNNAVTVYRTHRNISEHISLEELVGIIEENEAQRCIKMDIGLSTDEMITQSSMNNRTQRQGYLIALLKESNWNPGILGNAQLVAEAQDFQILWEKEQLRRISEATPLISDEQILKRMVNIVTPDSFPPWKAGALKNTRKTTKNKEKLELLQEDDTEIPISEKKKIIIKKQNTKRRKRKGDLDVESESDYDVTGETINYTVVSSSSSIPTQARKRVKSTTTNNNSNTVNSNLVADVSPREKRYNTRRRVQTYTDVEDSLDDSIYTSGDDDVGDIIEIPSNLGRSTDSLSDEEPDEEEDDEDGGDDPDDQTSDTEGTLDGDLYEENEEDEPDATDVEDGADDDEIDK